MGNLKRFEEKAFDRKIGVDDGMETDFGDKVAEYGLRMVIEMGRIILDARGAESLRMDRKKDGSVVSKADLGAEEFARNFIAENFPDHTVLGEESGGEMTDSWVWAIDPIDSTFDYVSGGNGFAVTACLYKDQKPYFSVVYSPANNNIYYRVGDKPSRVIIQGGFGEISGIDLPKTPNLINPEEEVQTLPPKVLLQPNARNTELAALLGREGGFGNIQRVGGSPALNIVGLACSPGAYVHDWRGRTTPFDLGAAIHILRGAGGVVQDFEKKDLPAFGYEGDVVAASKSEIANRIDKVSGRLSRRSKNPTSSELENGAVRIGIPNGGRLNGPSMQLFERAFLPISRLNERALWGRGDRWEKIYARFLRPDSIARFTESGTLDLGVTTRNIIEETGAKVEIVLALGFGECKLVVAGLPGSTLGSLQGKRIATSYPRITRAFFDKKGIPVEIIEEDGAIEGFPGIGLADAIVDVVESGTSLGANGLESIALVMDTEAVLVSGKNLSGNQKESVDFIKRSLEGAIEAANNKKVTCRVPKHATEKFMQIYRVYSEDPTNYLHNLTKIAETDTHIVFEFICRVNQVSKIMKVLRFGKENNEGLGNGLEITVEDIKILFK